MSITIDDMNERAQEVFRLIVNSYIETGKPVGSGTLSTMIARPISSASVRNVMADLEEMGLLYAPHTSAGRMPTQSGLRLFVDALMEVNNLDDEERRKIETIQAARNANPDNIFEHASRIVSGLSSCAAVVAAPKLDRAVRQIQFSHIGDNQTLAILVFADGTVENRIIRLPNDIPPASLAAAANYLNDRLAGRTLAQARATILQEITDNRTQLDALSKSVVEQGLAVADTETGHFFVRGHSNLLSDIKGAEDIETIQKLIDLLDQQETMAKILQSAEDGQGVRVYIGSENRLFRHAGLSMIVAPACNANQQVVGAIGVIGPTRLNYGRVVPIVDYTSQVIARLIG